MKKLKIQNFFQQFFITVLFNNLSEIFSSDKIIHYLKIENMVNSFEFPFNHQTA